MNNQQRVSYRFKQNQFMADIRAGSEFDNLREMGRDIGVSAGTLSRIDRGMLPDFMTFIIICSALDLEPGAYFERTVWKRQEDKS